PRMRSSAGASTITSSARTTRSTGPKQLARITRDSPTATGLPWRTNEPGGRPACHPLKLSERQRLDVRDVPAEVRGCCECNRCSCAEYSAALSSLQCCPSATLILPLRGADDVIGPTGKFCLDRRQQKLGPVVIQRMPSTLDRPSFLENP